MAEDRPALSGACQVCGHRGEYIVDASPTRENFRCEECGASLRYRNQAAALLAVTRSHAANISELVATPSFRDVSVYEPGVIGPFRRFFCTLPNYTTSYYGPDLPSGAERDGIRCENVEALTFPDESFDLVISSDIFEHVRHPMAGFAEVRRVLRPGGSHVFTVPFFWPLPGKTIKRVDVSGDEDVHLLEPVFHGSPLNPDGSLVYTDFGVDLPNDLVALGFDVVAHFGFRNAVTLVATRPQC